MMLRWALPIVLVLASTGLSLGAETLANIVEQANVGWLMGRWKGGEEFGAASQTEFQWALDKHVILVSFQSGQTEAKAMVVYHPDEQEVSHTSADNKGGSGRGHWTAENGHATLIYEHTSAEGEKIRIGLLHRKIDEMSMKVEVYPVRESGELEESPLMSASFKRVTDN